MTDLSCDRHTDLGVIRVTGTDAIRFLHAQTTADLAGLAADRGATSAWLSPQGRVRAMFELVPQSFGCWLILPAARTDWLVRELGRFILRADVALTADNTANLGTLIGDTASWLDAHGVNPIPGVVATIGAVTVFEPYAGCLRVIGASADIDLALEGIADARPGAGEAAAIRAGRAAVPDALSERYTAHMLNLDRIGAISFTKGCYPGQEIVARTEHLGTVRRRLQRFAVVDAGDRPEPGESLTDTDGEVIGEVNRAATMNGGTEILAVVPIDRADAAIVLADGRRLQALPLPY